MKVPQVRKYYDILQKKRLSLAVKRAFDIVASAVMLLLFSPVFLILAVAIKKDSEGPVFFRQERVTRYGKHFRIFKFRTMVNNADKIGSQVTVGNDSRITRVGHIIRKFRLDEICQLIDVFRGTMSFVGTRPEVPKYVEKYTPEMKATLLLPAGVTSQASICYKDEDKLLENAQDVDKNGDILLPDATATVNNVNLAPDQAIWIQHQDEYSQECDSIEELASRYAYYDITGMNVCPVNGEWETYNFSKPIRIDISKLKPKEQ